MPQTLDMNFNLDDRLVEVRERNLGVLVPIPLSERVEALTNRLYRDGHGRVSRKELIAALLYAAADDTAQLAEILKDYRTARVRDALVGDEDSSQNVVSFPRRAPGPRARTP